VLQELDFVLLLQFIVKVDQVIFRVALLGQVLELKKRHHAVIDEVGSVCRVRTVEELAETLKRLL